MASTALRRPDDLGGRCSSIGSRRVQVQIDERLGGFWYRHGE
jgi:hypothetical protein